MHLHEFGIRCKKLLNLILNKCDQVGGEQHCIFVDNVISNDVCNNIALWELLIQYQIRFRNIVFYCMINSENEAKLHIKNALYEKIDVFECFTIDYDDLSRPVYSNLDINENILGNNLRDMLNNQYISPGYSIPRVAHLLNNGNQYCIDNKIDYGEFMEVKIENNDQQTEFDQIRPIKPGLSFHESVSNSVEDILEDWSLISTNLDVQEQEFAGNFGQKLRWMREALKLKGY